MKVAINGGDGSAVSLPQNNIVGTRHCRLLISANINSGATGIDINTQIPDFFKKSGI